MHACTFFLKAEWLAAVLAEGTQQRQNYGGKAAVLHRRPQNRNRLSPKYVWIVQLGVTVCGIGFKKLFLILCIERIDEYPPSMQEPEQNIKAARNRHLRAHA